MKLEHGKKYVTQGGWVVEIMLVKQGGSEHYFATQKTSPGVSLIHGRTAAEYAKSNFTTWAQHCGWQYTTDGKRLYQHLQGIDPKDFAIVGEYPCEIDPPAGYVWAGGFPKVEKPAHGKVYLTSDGRACKCENIENGHGNTCWVNLPGIGGHRVLLQPVAQPQPEGEKYYVPTPKYTWDTQNKYFVKRSGRWYAWYGRDGVEIPEASDTYFQDLIRNKVIVTCSKEEAMARINGAKSPPKSEAMVAATPPTFEPPVVAATPRFVAPQDCFVSTPIPKEDQMNSSTFVSFAKSAASRTLRTGNYLYVEPAKIIGGYVKRSLRYVVFFGTLTGIVYGVNDPTSLKKKVASCMPKITIEMPSALK
jgi:hypothetical protein